MTFLNYEVQILMSNNNIKKKKKEKILLHLILLVDIYIFQNENEKLNGTFFLRSVYVKRFHNPEPHKL